MASWSLWPPPLAHACSCAAEARDFVKKRVGDRVLVNTIKNTLSCFVTRCSDCGAADNSVYLVTLGGATADLNDVWGRADTIAGT